MRIHKKTVNLHYTLLKLMRNREMKEINSKKTGSFLFLDFTIIENGDCSRLGRLKDITGWFFLLKT